MTAITAPITTDSSRTEVHAPSWHSGLVTGVLAAVVTTAAAMAAHAVGVSFEIEGEMIPWAGFAQMVLLGTFIGLVLARQLARRASSPRSIFVRTTVVLTALSCIPDVLVDADTGTKLALAATHVLAAAIVIPRLARDLTD
jgi:Family of unknown function (DUF6069)